MPHIANAKIVVLWEHELRAAARALEKLNIKGKQSLSVQEIRDALRACYAAIYSPELAGDAPVTVMSAQETLKTKKDKN